MAVRIKKGPQHTPVYSFKFEHGETSYTLKYRFPTKEQRLRDDAMLTASRNTIDSFGGPIAAADVNVQRTKERLKIALVGWDGFEDENGSAVPFSSATFDQACDQVDTLLDDAMECVTSAWALQTVEQSREELKKVLIAKGAIQKDEEQSEKNSEPGDSPKTPESSSNAESVSTTSETLTNPLCASGPDTGN